MFCILVISVASPKTFVEQWILFKTLAVVLQYLRDALNHVCILAKKKKKRKIKFWNLGSHFLLICANIMHAQGWSTASFNCCSNLAREHSITDEIFII